MFIKAQSVRMAVLGCAYVTDGLLWHADHILVHHRARVPRLLLRGEPRVGRVGLGPSSWQPKEHRVNSQSPLRWISHTSYLTFIQPGYIEKKKTYKFQTNIE